MQLSKRIQATATHLRRIYQSGVAVAMRVGGIKRNHAAALARIGCTVGNSWLEAERMARAMAFTPSLGSIAAAGAATGLPARCMPASVMCYSGHGTGGDDWIEPTRVAMAGRAARSASVRMARRMGLILLALLVGAWLTGGGK